MKVAVKEENLAMGIYGITLFLLTATVLEGMPATLFFSLTKLKYIYVLVMLVFCFLDGVVIVSRRYLVAVGLLVAHTVIYGVLLPGYQLGVQGKVHFEQLITIYAMITVTCFYVYKKDCFLKFLEATYLGLSAFVLLAVLLRPGDIVNPIYYINVFSDESRFRSDFGMGDINYCGNYCLYVLICGLFLKHEWKEKGVKISHFMHRYIPIVTIAGILMLFSTASRSAILSLALFSGLTWAFRNRQLLYRNRNRILAAAGILTLGILTVGFSSGLISEFWASSNREGNFTINYPLFLQFGNILTGMGYLDNSAFLNKQFGLETTAMDIYYLYILFTTGLTGMCIIVGQQIFILVQLIRHKDIKGRDMALGLFLMMLFYAVWQVNYMNYRYYTGLFHMGVLFLFLMEVGRGRDDWILVFKKG